MSVTLYPASAWPTIAPIWDTLVAATPDASFFVSRPWTDVWFEVFAEQLRPQILIVESGGGVIGACILVARTRRYGPVKWRRIHLNTAGEDEEDSPCLELNALLCRAGAEREVAEALWSHLEMQEWDEFVIEAASEATTLECVEAAAPAARAAHRHYMRERRSRPSYYVRLAGIADFTADYEQRLSRNTRDQVRRSLKLYGQTGEVAIEAAGSVPRALEMMAELADLHQKAWTARGRRGVFASPRFQAFHSALIRQAFPGGHIQVLRVATPVQTVGLLYNFVWRGKVCFYQSGLHYTDDNRYKPGLVSHVLAIRHAFEQGFGEYDFLAGESRYKSSLSTAGRTMVWATWRRLGHKQRLLALLRRLKRSIVR